MGLPKTLRPDAKGRVTLGSLAKGATGFAVSIDKHQRIVLEPLIEIPAHEKWLFDNKAALSQVKKGVDDAAKGNIVKKDFSIYLKKDEK